MASVRSGQRLFHSGYGCFQVAPKGSPQDTTKTSSQIDDTCGKAYFRNGEKTLDRQSRRELTEKKQRECQSQKWSKKSISVVPEQIHCSIWRAPHRRRSVFPKGRGVLQTVHSGSG